jgi:subtilisin family serine protease
MWVNELEKNGLDGVDDDGNGFIDDIHGYDFAQEDSIPEDTIPEDTIGHGTHVAGIIAATHNKFGIKGLNPNAKIMALKAMHGKEGHPKFAARAIRYAVDNGAKIINCSFIEFKETKELNESVAYAIKNNVIVVAAAGNNGKNIDRRQTSPAGLPGVITVGNLTNYREMHKSSNYGKKKVNIVAPGTGIRSTVLNNKYEYKQGTSMAAPFVSGAIALLFSTYEDFPVSEVIPRLYRTGKKSRFYKNKVSTGKRINVYKFIKGIN